MATTEQFSLRWNNFHSNITSGFQDLLEASDLVDVTLAVEGQFLHAHKLVLSICSPYFKEMFKMNPCKHPIIILKDVTHDNLKDILEFMYLGEVNVLRENLPIFLRTAELLQVKGLSCDDTQSNSSKSSSKSNDNKLDNLNLDEPLDDELTDENQQGLPLQTPFLSTPPTNHKRWRQHNTQSTPKKIKNESSSPVHTSNKNQIVAKEEVNPSLFEIAEHVVKVESPASANDSGQFEADDLPSDIRHPLNNDSALRFLNNVSNTSENTAQDPEVIMFSVDERGHVYCPYCYKKFVNRYNLKVHIRDKHDSSASNLDCVICKKTMRNKSCLRVHMYHHRKQEQMLLQAKLEANQTT